MVMVWILLVCLGIWCLMVFLLLLFKIEGIVGEKGEGWVVVVVGDFVWFLVWR